jgi:hypothetical protein
MDASLHSRNYVRRWNLNQRRTLLHIVPELRLGSVTVYLRELMQHLPDYHHVVWHATPMTDVNDTLIWALQVTGADILQVYDMQCLPNADQYDVAIVYDSPVPLQLTIPIIHYAYHTAPDQDYADLTLVPSGYMLRKLQSTHPAARVLVPGIRSRALRGLRRKHHNNTYTLGVFSSDEPGKYPYDLVAWLADNIPDDVGLVLSNTAALTAHKSRTLRYVPIIMDAALKGLQMVDVALYAHGNDYITPYGRMVTEIQASGTPVICERRGALIDRYVDRQHVLFFDNNEQILTHLTSLRHDNNMAETLSANGQLLASWEDITIHIGELKRILRMLGA